VRIRELLEILKEYDFIGTEMRPDTSGVRAGGLRRPTIQRAGNFPYDNDDPDKMYGQPQDYDRGNRGNGGLHLPLTPGTDADEWEDPDGLDEAMGAPTFFSKADTSQLGSSVPGMGGDWAHVPPKDWDEDDLAEAPLMVNPAPPTDSEEIPNANPEHSHDQTDDDLERKIDRIWHRDDNPSMTDPGEFQGGSMFPNGIFVFGGPLFGPAGFGGSMRPSRGRMGLMPKESVWRQVESFLKKYEK
jgi:hypothetical protein